MLLNQSQWYLEITTIVLSSVRSNSLRSIDMEYTRKSQDLIQELVSHYIYKEQNPNWAELQVAPSVVYTGSSNESPTNDCAARLYISSGLTLSMVRLMFSYSSISQGTNHQYLRCSNALHAHRYGQRGDLRYGFLYRFRHRWHP